MSLSKNQHFKYWKEVEASLRSTDFTCCGDHLVEGDRTTVSQVYTLWCLTIQDLCGASRLRSNKALRAWIFQVGSYPIESVVDSLKVIAALMRDHNHDMGFENLTAETFKQSLEGSGRLARLLLSPITDLLDCFLRECHSTMLQCLLTCLEFPCRMTISQLPSLLRKEQETYLDLESEMETWEYPEDLVAELEAIVRAVFIDWPGFSFWPQHGTGSVSDVRGKDATRKYDVLLRRGLPPRLHHYFAQNGCSHPLVAMDKVDPGTSCRVLFVPKGASSKRVISSEPTANQWFQQALRRDLADYLPRSFLRITMEDQTRNQELAQVGSLYRNYGTIDLSSASDTVSNRLVEALFKRTPIWSELWSSRSSYAVCGRTRIKLNKFAPMGSAVCFPIESIVFACVVQLAQEHVGVHHNFVVYGDDIICHSSVFDEVLRLLAAFHFRVNEKKTFHPVSPFKESCGKEYYYGDDVTPFRIPRFFQGWNKPEELRESPQRLAGWISLANRMADGGLQLARTYLVERLLELCPKVVFSQHSRYLAIQSPWATNFHLDEKFEDEMSSLSTKRRNLCRGRLVKGVVLFTKPSPGDDNIRYQMLLEQYLHTTRVALQWPDDLIQLNAGPSQLMAGMRWLSDAELTRPNWEESNRYQMANSSIIAVKPPSGFEFCSCSDDGSEWRLRA